MPYKYASLALLAFSAAIESTSAAEKDLAVAIYGGGLASATLAQTLKSYSHIDLQYFDPALNLTPTSFRLLGFDPKVHDALALIGDEAGGAINRAGWYPEEPSIVIVGQGPDAGKVVLDYSALPNTTHRPQVTVVDPAPFLMEMLNGTDSQRLHPNKTLVSIVQLPQGSAAHPLELRFQDGSIHYADVLVGDDGPFGLMRSQVLGSTHPATPPVFMNFLSAVAHVAPKEAEKHLGHKYGNKAAGRRFERVGVGSWFLNAYLDGFFTCLGSFYSGEPYDISRLTRPTSAEELRARFGGLEGGEGITRVLSRFSGLQLIPEMEHLPAPRYANGFVAMMGSAAHMMTNFQQLGPGQDIEDAMILGTLIREAQNKKGLEAALYAYDAVRRPRSQWVSEHGKRLGWLWMGMVERVGIQVDELRSALLDWKEESEQFDMKTHKAKALEIMEKRLGSRNTNACESGPGSKFMSGFETVTVEAIKKSMQETLEL
ncbi:hypothetical protein K505DRAFT_239782 [Melanomma pulvis-pyrius CBS 109.77]|uniref:FAD/NAD(P)-binding domain-containing protein n=1 Tax=Melanomma pulvis-pyrius CBS 109.77 TaxID=1314802 RepID=A0A6A6XIP6_9PLEO|nr:hypothetical protein K505DRAFT_239782 [Melanomma pulvis-pyrius CBS 109.77]